MTEPADKTIPKLPRRKRRLLRLFLIGVIVAGLCGYYAGRHLSDVLLAVAHREAPNMRISFGGAALVSPNRLEIRNLSVRLRKGNAEILHLSRATIDFSIQGLRNQIIDAVTVDDPVVLINDALLKEWPADLPAQKKEQARPWTFGVCTVRGGKARLDLSQYPGVEFEFASESQGGSAGTLSSLVQRVELKQIKITGRDKQTPSGAEIEAIAAQFALDEIVSGHLRELIVRKPSLRLTSEVLKYLPEKSSGQNATFDIAGANFRVDRLLIEHGEAQVSNLGGASLPEASFKFGLDTTDVRMGGDGAEKLHFAQLWEIAVWPASSRSKQFLTIDSAQVNLTPAGLLTRKEFADVIVTGMVFRAGEDFRTIVAQAQANPAAPGQAPESTKPWMIRNLAVHNGRVAVADLGVEIPEVQFDLNTRLNDVPLSSDIAFASNDMQRMEFADFTLHSPLDPFVTVVNLKTIFVNFSFAQIMRREIDALVLLNPTIYIAPDLFWYVDQLKKRQAESAPAVPSPGKKDAAWRLNRFDVAYGQLVIANEGQAQVPLPLSFSTHAENISFSNFNDLQLKLNLLVPTADYSFPDYQIEFNQLGGEIKFGLPPEKQVNNLVQTLRSDSVRWRQFTGRKIFWSVTYDEKGIYGEFGGAGYGGYVNGQFSFFLKPNSPWEGWISGSKVDLGQLTDVIAPENFKMTGPVDFTMNVKALSREIQHVTGKFNTKRSGHFRIGKLDYLLANIPLQWSGFKQSAARIGLETLRDFDYDSGNGDFSFAGKAGKFTLKLQGPNGSRNFDIVVH